MSRHPLCVIPSDITCIAPPCLTPERAEEIYTPAFKRIMEYVTNSRVEGDVLEFGTFHGYTARTLAELMYQHQHKGSLWLYDSWEGFPDMLGVDAACPEVTQHETWKKGDCTPVIPHADKIIQQVLSIILPNRVNCVKGFYENSFTGERRKASIVHIDCDLYESTKYVLSQLLAHDCLAEGAVIMFDDWNNNFASNKHGERKAVGDLFPIAGATALWNCPVNPVIGLEPWFTYGSSGKAFIVQKA